MRTGKSNGGGVIHLAQAIGLGLLLQRHYIPNDQWIGIIHHWKELVFT